MACAVGPNQLPIRGAVLASRCIWERVSPAATGSSEDGEGSVNGIAEFSKRSWPTRSPVVLDHYKPGKGGYVGFDNPEREFFKRWRKEHHAIWPGHMEAEPDHPSLDQDHKQKNRHMARLMDAVTHPWIASYGVSLKLANNSGNTYAPLVLCSPRKTEK